MQTNPLQLISGVDLTRVHGLEAAKSYPIGINSRLALFDDNDDIFYIKSTDQNGFPSIKRYRFTEEVIIDQDNNGYGLALNDIKSLISEAVAGAIEPIREELKDVKQSISTNANTSKGNYSNNKPYNNRNNSTNRQQSSTSGDVQTAEE